MAERRPLVLIGGQVQTLPSGDTLPGGGGGGGSEPDYADPTVARVFVDDFIWTSGETGEIGELGWSFANGSAPAYTGALDGDHPGVARRTSGTTAGQYATMHPGAGTNAVVMTAASMSECTWIVLIETTGGEADFHFGITGVLVSSVPNDSVFIERLAGETTWFACVKNSAGTVTRTAMSNFISGGWFKLKLRQITATSWGFSINDGTETLISVGISQTVARQPMAIIKPTTTTARGMIIDFFSMKLFASSR